ncbi:MAG: hypothetical protein AAF998_19145 [Bacteroidota bacterium]
MLKNLTFKKLFLIDGMGAIITALMLSHVLARLESFFGMPRQILFILAGIAAGFAVYSILCHFLVRENWRPFLRGIATANIAYCIVTFGLVVYLFDTLTYLGIAYFIGEIILVVGLARFEFEFARKGESANHASS